MPQTPQRLKGFQDFFAKDMQIKSFIIETIKKTYESYGYEPLETPALELSEFILGQSGAEAEKQYFRFRDNGDRDVMLKFEVMTSMCRAVAQNINNLPLPYKRYQIQPVWRAENTQKGRYREFTQCDADVIGSSSMTADAEYIQMGIEAVTNLGFKNFVARISNKKFLEGLAEFVKIPEDKWYGFQISVDKLEKIGKEAVIAEMITERGILEEQARQALNIIDAETYDNLSFEDRINLFKNNVGTTKPGNEALQELSQMLDFLKLVNADSSKFEFDPTIARGLASYTGPVWEFKVIDGGVGSISGGGRYDKAIGKYLGFEVPATGGSLGLERIMDIMKDRQMTEFTDSTVQVLVSVFSADLLPESIKTAQALRDQGLKVMLYPDLDNLGKQFKYADKKGIKKVVVIGPDEAAKGIAKLKNMDTGLEEEMVLS